MSRMGYYLEDINDAIDMYADCIHDDSIITAKQQQEILDELERLRLVCLPTLTLVQVHGGGSVGGGGQKSPLGSRNIAPVRGYIPVPCT